MVTGSRADFGLLNPIMKKIMRSDKLELSVLAVGSHFLDSQGHTIDDVTRNGIHVDECVAVNYDDSADGLATAISGIISESTGALQRLQPDIVVVLGDRFEIFSVTIAATILRIPIAHIAGGDTTLGAYDEGLRHSITKMAHLHFTTHKDAARRIRQLGEEQWRIHVVGSPGIDALKQEKLLSRDTLERDFSWKFLKRNVLVTLHPVTLQPGSAQIQARHLAAALERLGNDVGVVVTGTNADSEGSQINRVLRSCAAMNSPRWLHVQSLGHQHYVSMLAEVDAVVGNSSSGLYEAPSLGVPSVDIGLRQMGRPRARSVIHCDPDSASIEQALQIALDLGRTRPDDLYGDGRAADRIVATLRSIDRPESLLVKAFIDQLEDDS